MFGARPHPSAAMAAVFPLVDPEGPRPPPGLAWAFRFRLDGSAETLPIDHAIDPEAIEEGWLWLHFNLGDQRSRSWLSSSPHVHVAAREALVSHEEHQQLQMAHDC